MIEQQSLNISRAIQHPFEDTDWMKKIGIGALVNLVPVLNFAGIGYMLEIVRNNVAGRDLPLPEWNDIGGKLVEGLKLAVVFLVLGLPIFLLLCVMTAGMGGLAAVADQSGGDTAQALGAGMGLLGIAIGCISLIYGLFLAYLQPAIVMQFIKTRSIGGALRIGEVLAIARKNSGQYITIVAVGLGLGLVIGLIGSIPILGWIVILAAAPLIQVILGHLIGQYARLNNI